MLEHEQARTAHQEDALALAPAQEPEPAVERQPAAEAVPPAASMEELTGQPAVATQAGPKPEEQPELATSDTVIEQLAHGMVAKELDDNDEKYLADQRLPGDCRSSAASTSS